jgi:hypothetical protein
MRDVVVLAVVVALFVVLGWVLTHVSVDLTRPVPPTTTTDLVHPR